MAFWESVAGENNEDQLKQVGSSVDGCKWLQWVLLIQLNAVKTESINLYCAFMKR